MNQALYLQFTYPHNDLQMKTGRIYFNCTAMNRDSEGLNYVP